jgi:hypothetical protein
MNKAYREYELNGWSIRASELYNDWELQPVYETIEEWENFINNENIRFKRLIECKKWVKTQEAEDLKNKYKAKAKNKSNNIVINQTKGDSKTFYIYQNKAYAYDYNKRLGVAGSWRVITNKLKDDIQEQFKDDIAEGWKIIYLD